MRGEGHRKLVNVEIAELNEILEEASERDKLVWMDFLKSGALRWSLFLAIFIKVINLEIILHEKMNEII